MLVDYTINLLVTGLYDLGLSSCVNLIILADHGGATAGFNKIIHLDEYIDHLYDKAYFFGGAFSRINLKYKSQGRFILINLKCKNQSNFILNISKENKSQFNFIHYKK